jgi:hypothetical protein
MKNITRREILGSAGMTAGLSLLAGYAGAIHAASPSEEGTPTAPPKNEASPSSDKPDNHWHYAQLSPTAVADAAYKAYDDGGCMYGLFFGVMSILAKEHEGPYLSFPFYMLRYGAGGVGHWGSLCGTLNGGAALIGLFEPDKQRSENLIAELFSWYEAAEVPAYCPKVDKDALTIPKSVSGPFCVMHPWAIGASCRAMRQAVPKGKSVVVG